VGGVLIHTNIGTVQCTIDGNIAHRAYEWIMAQQAVATDSIRFHSIRFDMSMRCDSVSFAPPNYGRHAVRRGICWSCQRATNDGQSPLSRSCQRQRQWSMATEEQTQLAIKRGRGPGDRIELFESPQGEGWSNGHLILLEYIIFLVFISNI